MIEERWDDDAGRLHIAVRGYDASKTNLRCGKSLCDVKVRRLRDSIEVLIWARIGPPVWVDLEVVVADQPRGVEIDGQELTPLMHDGVISLSFQAGQETEVLIPQPPAPGP